MLVLFCVVLACVCVCPRACDCINNSSHSAVEVASPRPPPPTPHHVTLVGDFWHSTGQADRIAIADEDSSASLPAHLPSFQRHLVPTNALMTQPLPCHVIRLCGRATCFDHHVKLGEFAIMPYDLTSSTCRLTQFVTIPFDLIRHHIRRVDFAIMSVDLNWAPRPFVRVGMVAEFGRICTTTQRTR